MEKLVERHTRGRAQRQLRYGGPSAACQPEAGYQQKQQQYRAGYAGYQIPGMSRDARVHGAIIPLGGQRISHAASLKWSVQPQRSRFEPAAILSGGYLER